MLQRTKRLKKDYNTSLKKYQKSKARKENQLGKTNKQTTTATATATKETIKKQQQQQQPIFPKDFSKIVYLFLSQKSAY